MNGGEALAEEKRREPGWSFCIITNGARPEKLQREIQSIRALAIPAYEILVGGAVPPWVEGENVTTVPVPEAAQAGRLGEMRNRLTERARYDHLVVADDDMFFTTDFYRGVLAHGEDYDVLCVRLLNPDGSRFWDWASYGGPDVHTLLDYEVAEDPNLYVTGGLCIMKARVADRVQWDEGRGFYQQEDIDFSARLKKAGMRISFCRQATVVHDDARYTQVGRQVFCFSPFKLRILRMLCGKGFLRDTHMSNFARRSGMTDGQ